MSSSLRRQITNVCLVVALGCAFLFEQAGGFSWVLGWLAVCAGIVAVLTHFAHLDNAAEDETSASESLTENADETLEFGDPSVPNDPQEPSRIWGDASREYLPQPRILLSAEYASRFAAAEIFFHDSTKEIVRSSLFIQRPKQADRIVEVVEKLSASAGGTRYEFTVSADGDLTIRSLGRDASPTYPWPSFDLEETEDDSSVTTPVTRPN